MMTKYVTNVFFITTMVLMNVPAQHIQSDNGDGTYTNPIIYSDFPDPDVIRVDSAYYMVSTTMFIFPGVTILKYSISNAGNNFQSKKMMFIKLNEVQGSPDSKEA